MRSEGSLPKVKIKPWIFLFSLSVLISIPSTASEKECTWPRGGPKNVPKITYIVKDEFGMVTSAPRVGGTLELTCTNE